MTILDRAIIWATELHAGQVDKAGEPYILHPLRVMNAVRHLGEEAMALAVLHDTMEDCGVTPEAVFRRGYSLSFAAQLQALSRHQTESYHDFTRRCALFPLTIEIKLADLADNMNLERLPEIRSHDVERYKKYRDARDYLLARRAAHQSEGTEETK